MSCERYIFTEPKCRIRDNFALLTGFFTKLDSFEKQSDDVYLLANKGAGRQPMPDVIFRFDHASCAAMMEINAHPPPVEDDLLKLFAEIKKHTRLTIRDEDGEISDWCM